MKACVKNAYNIPTADLNQSGEQQIKVLSLADLRKTDYFDRV
jgi:hypothetical protein